MNFNGLFQKCWLLHSYIPKHLEKELGISLYVRDTAVIHKEVGQELIVCVLGIWVFTLEMINTDISVWKHKKCFYVPKGIGVIFSFLQLIVYKKSLLC